MTITTLGILWNVTPTLIKNAFRHYVRFFLEFGVRSPRESANDFLYDQIFHMIKRLTVYLTHHTIEEVQKLTDQSVPNPPRCYDEQVMIPLECCHQAADLLHEYFGPEMMQSFIGGSRWWQMRSQPGIPAEWISHYSDYHTLMEKRGQNPSFSTSFLHHITRHSKRVNPRHEHPADVDPSATHHAGRFADTHEESRRLERIMLYIHGGAYYFGSINTHKYAIHRASTKFGGFTLAVNYRKAPQFPFPCAIQDCLAAYLYLLRPPPGALHPPIDSSRIVVAGDSAGGGLALALLQLIRDLSLPVPAGGVLISPWSDMTHSFPSILQNTQTDYIPPYSFLHKPSLLWPVPQDVGRFAKRKSWLPFGGRKHVKARSTDTLPAHQQPLYMLQPDGSSKLVEPQIQMYATNAQLLHPLCSPVLAGSLGGLPPLFILAGDGEVLRDEVLYLAHRAAHPAEHPLSEALLSRFPRSRETAARYKNVPTYVHLQVFDDQCHVFPMFLYTTAARLALRGMASFIKMVTGAPLAESGTIAELYGSAPAGKYEYSGKVPLQRPGYENHMIRERIGREGHVRPMEPASHMSMLQLAPAQVGVVYARTYERFRRGHTIWDNKFRSQTKRLIKKRTQFERRARRLLDKAEAEGLLTDCGDILASGTRWTDLGSYGPADLQDEMPPPSAIVGRRDTPDALALLKLGLHLRAKRRRALGVEVQPPTGHRRASFAERAPRRAYSTGEHVHRPTERP
ncbi:hypothetical protein MCAP1_003449 [Malassezia caprae]|uniref:Alpha/beta hydrolase fold-3 domain-containing protein n=1 Tax=Malassezia caprae TaxID=1381934 RepID=A0AAF0IY96_9BASI|nr:hypothetical protein MCAP1_003449 [Malassezia caprae]